MNVQEQKITQSINIEVVQKVVAEAVTQITTEMVKALMSGLQENLDFKKLAEKHISPTLKEELSASDEKIQMIYQKLFLATFEHIQKNSAPLVTTFALMSHQTNNMESAGMFLGTFVLPKVNSIIEILKVEQPEALDNKEIWK